MNNAQETAQESPFRESHQGALIVYGSNTCHYCIETKAYLKKKNIPFTFYDIDQDSKKMHEMFTKLTKKGINTSNVKLPVVDSSGKLWINNSGFDSFLRDISQKN